MKLIIISLAMSSLLLLMLISVEPEIQYSVDEVMENPNNYENEFLFLRGDYLIRASPQSKIHLLYRE